MIDASPAANLQHGFKPQKEAYTMDFDLFKFNEFTTLTQATYFKGANCKELFSQLVNEVCLSKNCLRQHLAKELSVLYQSDLSTMQKFILSKEYFPVYLTSKFISFLSKERQVYFLTEFNISAEYFKFGTSRGWIKFPKKMSAELAWLCGAISADGWINKETSTGNEKLGIIDFHKNALQKASDFFEKCFGYKSVVKRHQTQNCWQIVFRCKPITQFFTTYLGFHYGVKVYDICEPEIIKTSQYRLDFASGVLTFDGSVAIDGTVSLGCASEKLVKDIWEILRLYEFKAKLSAKKTDKQTLYFVKSKGLLKHKDAEKWIALFGLDVEKGQRLNSLINGFTAKVTSEEDALSRLKTFVNYPSKKQCPMNIIFETLKREGSVKRQELLTKTKLPHVTFYKYVWVLRKANMVSCYTGQFWRGFENTYHFNYNQNEWRVPNVS